MRSVARFAQIAGKADATAGAAAIGDAANQFGLELAVRNRGLGRAFARR
jgi:hypothetical protein